MKYRLTHAVAFDQWKQISHAGAITCVNWKFLAYYMLYKNCDIDKCNCSLTFKISHSTLIHAIWKLSSWDFKISAFNLRISKYTFTFALSWIVFNLFVVLKNCFAHRELGTSAAAGYCWKAVFIIRWQVWLLI